MALTVRDDVTISLTYSAIAESAPNRYITVVEQPIGKTGLKWAFRVYKKKEGQALRFCLWVSGPIQASGTFSWGDDERGMKVFGPIQLNTGETVVAEGATVYAFGKYDGYVSCEAEFKTNSADIVLPTVNVSEFFEDATHYVPDAEIVVGDERLKVHRSILSMMSPVFHGYFQHGTQESQTGVINITDFEFKTVKNVIDFAYGRSIGKKPVTEVIDMLQFADKYDIKTISKLERSYAILNLQTFSAVVQYAWKCDRTELQSKCAKFYRENVQTLTFSPDFVQLIPEIQSAIICAAASQPTG